MLEFFAGLFDPSGFPPRKTAGAWTPELIWLHATSDLLIWLACLSAPLVLLYFSRRRALPHRRLFALVGLFLLASGTAHLIDALAFEYPVYRLAGGVKLAAAVLAWAAVVALVPVIPRVTESPGARAGRDTQLHRPLPAGRTRRRAEWVRDYTVAILVAGLAVLVRAAID